MVFTTLIAAALAGAAVALPEPRNFCQTFTDTFDDIPGSATGIPIITYHGLTYQGFKDDAKTKDPVTNQYNNVQPHSGANVAIASATSDLVQLGNINFTPFGNILAGPAKSFDLRSFYFGCAVMTEQDAAGTALACTIALTGYDIFNKQVGMQTLSYAPESINAPANFFQLPSQFSNLKNVTFGIVGTSLDAPDTAVIELDDVVHCNY